MIKRFHEAPKSIFKDVQGVTDGDYALVNLFDEDEEYFNLFKDAVASGREVILDNGVFELGEAWNSDDFAGWVEKLQPTYYIVPDVLEDYKDTVESFNRFIKAYPHLPGKRIGVAQGKTYREVCKCYQAIEPYCDKVAIGFDYSWYQRCSLPGGGASTLMKAMHGRRRALIKMEEEGIINRSKPHHLLGVMLPQEVKAYGQLQSMGEFMWLDSIDTSNPVVHGLKGIRYSVDGLRNKETQKLYTMINSEVSERQKEFIMYNIEMFRRFCNND